MAEAAITVLGATGYTGGLIVHELRRRQIAVLAAARNPEKLRRLAATLSDVETVVADMGDGAALERLARRSRVIINTVGPFVDYGEPVVRAAIDNGAHYLDTTGEQPFIKKMLAHHEGAQRQHVAVVCAQAFEIAVSDCAAAVLADGCTDVAAVSVTYLMPLHASQGTRRTMLRMLQIPGYAYVGGEWVEEPPARLMRAVQFPEPLGTITAASFPSAEVITIPRHVNAREVRAFMRIPAGTATLLSAAVPLVRMLLRTPLARLAASSIGGGTSGPDEATRSRDEFHLLVEVRGVRAGHASVRRMALAGRDPYGLTAVIAAQAAVLMSAAGYDRAGVLTPAQAFAPGPFLEYLKPFGLIYEIDEVSRT